jgi:hypothetical protein
MVRLDRATGGDTMERAMARLDRAIGGNPMERPMARSSRAMTCVNVSGRWNNPESGPLD